jgi:putative YhdH/YhfP family quinone oxidoreductase
MGTRPSPGAGPPSHFSAFVVEGRGDAVETGVRTFAPSDLSPGEVIVGVDWSAVNYKDAMVTRPGNRVARVSPLVPGVDLVGTVLASEDPSVPVGLSVIVHGHDLGVAHSGGFSEVARVPAGWLVPLPVGLSPREAAIIGTAGFTAALSLRRLEDHGLRRGDGPVLVTGASGGVGSMAVSLLAGRGYEVVASTGRTSERSYLTTLGAAEVIDRHDLDGGPGRTLGPERWAGAVDCVGGPTLAAVLRSLRYGAAVAASGLTGGNTLDTTVYPFIVRSVSLLGVDSVRTPMAERRAVWEGLATSWSPELLEGMVHDEVGLDQLGPALERILAGQVRGRVLVRPGRSA